jgi:ribosomal protein S13
MFRLVAGGDSGTSILIARRQPSVFERMRRKRRGLRARGQRDRTRAKSKGKFQKVAAFHDISLFVYGE